MFVTDILVILAIVIVLLLALRPALKHMRGKGSCCGGDDYRAKPKKLRSVAEKRTYQVEGIHCQNCVNRVMEALNSMDGVSAVVSLSGKTVVSLERPVEDAAIRAAVEKAGYTVE